MKRMALSILVGMLLGWIVTPRDAWAQVPAQIYAVYNGLPKALVSDSTGRLRIFAE